MKSFVDGKARDGRLSFHLISKQLLRLGESGNRGGFPRPVGAVVNLHLGSTASISAVTLLGFAGQLSRKTVSASRSKSPQKVPGCR